MDHGFHSYLKYPEDTPYPLFSHWWWNFPMDHPSFLTRRLVSRRRAPVLGQHGDRCKNESTDVSDWEFGNSVGISPWKNVDVVQKPWWITTHGSYPSFCVRGGATIQTLEIPFDKIAVEMSSWFDRNIICKWWVMWVFRCHLRLQEGSKNTGITHNILAGLTQSFPKFVPWIEAQIMRASQLALVQIDKNSKSNMQTSKQIAHNRSRKKCGCI
jgi:hypothetical protein